MAQDVAQSAGWDIQGSVQIVRTGRSYGEAGVEALDEPGQEDVAVCHAGHAREAEFFNQAILKGAVDALDPAFGLAGVGADDLDVQFRQCSAELRHALTTLGVGLGDAKHRMLVRVEGDWHRAPPRASK